MHATALNFFSACQGVHPLQPPTQFLKQKLFSQFALLSTRRQSIRHSQVLCEGLFIIHISSRYIETVFGHPMRVASGITSFPYMQWQKTTSALHNTARARYLLDLSPDRLHFCKVDSTPIQIWLNLALPFAHVILHGYLALEMK